ncbi:MAG: glutaredoxin family protein [Solirubrobacterales bacterium]
MTTLTFYSRPGCGLCESARVELDGMRADGMKFEVNEVNIDDDDGLLKRFLALIPVVELDGVVLSELRLDPHELRAKLDTVLP